MRYYWYSSEQNEMVQQFRFESGEDYSINEVKVGDTWRKFSEAGIKDKPAGLWEDYEFVAKGENLETRIRFL